MPDDTITLVSTTDSPAEVQAALTGKPVAPPPAEEPAAPAAEAPAAEAKAADAESQEPAPPPANETVEQRESREASEAGSKLAKRREKIQAQIDDAIRRKSDVRRDVEAEEARLADLRRQRQELEAAAQPPAELPAAPVAAGADTKGPIGRPEPKLDATDDKGDAKYATYEDYLSDHAIWAREEAILAAKKVVDDERQADRARIERESTSRVVNERLAVFQQSLEAFKKAHADFDAVFDDAKDAVQETLVGIGPNALKVIDGYTVFDAQDGPALMYHLLKHPEELKAIALKPQPQQLVHLARLDERLRPAAAAPKRTGPAATAPDTKAPEPIRPVGTGPTATTVSPDEESYQDYKHRRNRELRSRAGL